MSDTDRLRDFIQERNLSQADLARRLGYAPNYVNRIFAGITPVTPGFRGRFLVAFGAEAVSVLAQPQEQTQ